MTRNWTSQQAALHEAKMRAMKQKPDHVADFLDTVENESLLQQQIVDYCRLKGWMAFRGSMAHKTYRLRGEADFTILLPARDCVCHNCGTVEPVSMMFRHHCREADGGSGAGPRPIARTLFVECKTRRGTLSEDQKAIHAQAQALGHTIHVVRSPEQFLEAVRRV